MFFKFKREQLYLSEIVATQKELK